MYLFLAFLMVPLIEIALFIQVGGLIGLWPTLACVVLTAVLGTALMRSQGRQAMNHLRETFSQMQDPIEPLVHGAMILVAGVLLLTPGFFTDALGFMLLVPGLRMAVYRWLRTRIKVEDFVVRRGPANMRAGPRNGDIIDGQYEDVTPRDGRSSGPSGWVSDDATRH